MTSHTDPPAPAATLKIEAGVAWITIDRPDNHNLLDAEVLVHLSEAWAEIRDDDRVRVAVLTATGADDFCCGGDLGSVIPLWTGAKEPETELEHKLIADRQMVSKVMLKDRLFPKPVIGAMNGRALGGGFEMMLGTDIRVAAEHATFGVPEPQSGLVPGAGTMARLARQISHADAMKLLLTGDPISAHEAQRIGLINEVVPASALVDRAAELAERIVRNAPLALGAIKQTVHETHTMDWPDAFDAEGKAAGRVMRSRDAREGPRAFKERRPPTFTGE